MDFAKFKRRIEDIDTSEGMCNTLNDIIDKEIIKANNEIYLKLLLEQKNNDFTKFSNFLKLFKKEKIEEKLIWEKEKKNTQTNFTQINSITQRDFVKYCEKEIWKATNQIEIIEFGIKYLNEKIEELKKTYNVEIIQSSNNINISVEESISNPSFKKESIQDYCAFSRKDGQYMIKYLDELNTIFHFDNPKTKKQIFGAICLILFEKEEDKKKIFKDIKSFTDLAELLSKYWNCPLPKDIRINKYKDKANELKGKYSILEQQLL
jgi:hypothetical protein